MNAKLISVTPDAEKIMGYIARVSNPSGQDNPNFENLLKYCIKHHHWSVFEHSHLTIEVNTTLAIAPQILRHGTAFKFQQFSQRYADSSSLLDSKIPLFELRAQDYTNRQNSLDTISQEIKDKFNARIEEHFKEALALYQDMLNEGIAKECARNVLPTATPTRLYITGNCRGWIHYLQLRGEVESGTQKEHRILAEECKNIFISCFPTVSKALNWI